MSRCFFCFLRHFHKPYSVSFCEIEVFRSSCPPVFHCCSAEKHDRGCFVTFRQIQFLTHFAVEFESVDCKSAPAGPDPQCLRVNIEIAQCNIWISLFAGSFVGDSAHYHVRSFAENNIFSIAYIEMAMNY